MKKIALLVLVAFALLTFLPGCAPQRDPVENVMSNQEFSENTWSYDLLMYQGLPNWFAMADWNDVDVTAEDGTVLSFSTDHPEAFDVAGNNTNHLIVTLRDGYSDIEIFIFVAKYPDGNKPVTVHFVHSAVCR